MKKSIALIASFLLFCIFTPLAADDSFGFGFDDVDLGSSGGGAPAVTVSGEAGVSAIGYIDELDNFESLKAFDAGSLFSGSLGFAASSANVEAEIKLDLDGSKANPLFLNEAWVRSYWGKFDLEAGLKKLTWGKADNEGILDVVNPLDYSDLSVTDQMKRKIARPLLHASYAAGAFTRIEAVFIPGFEPNRLALDGRWAPAALTGLSSGIEAGAAQAVTQTLAGISDFLPQTNALSYAQYGLRLNTTLGSHDLGFQYFYGNRGDPSVSIDSATLYVPAINFTEPNDSTLAFNPSAVKVGYDRYHQVGVDWATVLGGFNVRSEVAVNLTSDLAGDDGAVANSSALWLLGFDRDLFAGINLNAQGSGSVRFMHSKLGEAPDDCEGGSDLSRTRLMARLSKKVFKDEIELSLTGLWGVEDADFLAMPELEWTKEALTVGLRAGFFGGKKEGNLGQYRGNNYVTLSMKYAF